MKDRLSFDTFQRLNFERASAAFQPQCLKADFLALAIAGEAGELCNLIKKALRGDFELIDRRKDILDEISDVMTYCDLFMSVMAANTGEQIESKWDEVSGRRGWKRLESAIREAK